MNVRLWLKQAKHPDADLILLEVLSNWFASGHASRQPAVAGVARSFSLVSSERPRSQTNLDKTYLVSHSEFELPADVVKKADQWIKRRKQGEPLAYILGYREFYGRDFKVTPDVLIPRPETEVMIDMVKEMGPERIIEVGTGSGCIAISLALELPDAQIEAVDISEAALEVAEANREKFGIDPDRLVFAKSNLLADVATLVADVVLANLPYVDKGWDWLDQQALDYEPTQALYADGGGLALVNKLIVQFTDMGIAKELILEADPSQHQKIIDFARKQGLEHVETRGFICRLRVSR